MSEKELISILSQIPATKETVLGLIGWALGAAQAIGYSPDQVIQVIQALAHDKIPEPKKLNNKFN